MAAFGFFEPQKGQTAEGIAKSRAMAAALLRSGNVPKNVGEGLSAIGDAIFYRSLVGDADASEKAQTEAFNSSYPSLIAPYTGGQQTSPASGGVAAAIAPTNWDPTNLDPSIKTGIADTASALGVSPVDLATAISYETGGTFDPTKGGPTTQWGQHRGFIQFGEPQAQKYAVDWNNPIGSQLGANGAVANYLRDTGVKPGTGLLDIYSAINAGGVGRYNASDANNGGAPGTVRDKVEQQMAGHRAKANAMFADYNPNAATDAISSVAPQAGYRDPMVTTAYANPAPPTAAAPQLPAPTTVSAPPAVAEAAPMPAPQQVAQNFQPQQIDPRLIEAANSPFATPGQKAILGGIIQQQQTRNQLLLKQQMEQADPGYQMDLETKQLNLNKLRNPGEPAEIQELRIRAKEAGILPGTPEYQALFSTGGKSPLVTVNNGDNSGAFAKKSDEDAATRLGTIVSEGNAAPQMMGDLQQLADLGKQIGTGKGAQVTAAIGPYAQALGIDIKGLDESQAFTAIVNRLAPQMRPVGAGATSDFDAKQFLSSLPSLGNQPGGNELISQTFQAVQQNKISAAEIASKAQSGEMKWQEAERQIRALPNPYEVFKANRDKLGKANASENPLPPTPVPQGQRQRAINPQTNQVIEFDGKGWVPVQ